MPKLRLTGIMYDVKNHKNNSLFMRDKIKGQMLYFRPIHWTSEK